MKNFLDSIRLPDKESTLLKNIFNAFLITIFGIILGIFSKWLDNLSIDDTIWWQHVIGIMDLGNVFSEFGIWVFIAVSISVYSKRPILASLNVFLFFLGMTVSYHLYTIYFSGFNPLSYMKIWYSLTALTPFLACVTWYAKGIDKWSIMISVVVLAIMMLFSFGIGMWYFDFKSNIDTLLFLGTVLVLYTKPKNCIYSLIGALIIVYIFRMLF